MQSCLQQVNRHRSRRRCRRGDRRGGAGCVGGCAAPCRSDRPATILVSAACGIAVLRRLSCSGSLDQGAKPRRSSRGWRSSCATNSSWNCPQDKTLITHAASQAARFLGYEISVQHARHEDHPAVVGRSTADRPVRVPRDVIQSKCAAYMKSGKPALRGPLLHRRGFHDRRDSTGPNTAGSSSTTCSPRTCSAWAGCAGSWRPRCSRPWPRSTVVGDEDGPQVPGDHRHP